MKSKITTIIAMLALSVGSIAQSNDSTTNFKFSHSVGFNYGSTTGKGLAYEFGINKLSFQIAGHPLIQKDQKTYDVALTLKYKFRDKKHVDFLTYMGANYVYQWQIENNYSSINEKTNIGAGLGFEFDTQRNINLKLMGGYGAYFTNNSYNIAPAVEASIMYKL